MLPNYICDVIPKVITQSGINIRYYNIKDNFSPEWENIYDKIDKMTSAILMVHFFGIPQNIEKFIRFAKEKKIYLIEDNAHGYGGLTNNQLLGDFGDISISSPRKIFNTFSGGILKINISKSIDIKLIKPYPINIFQKVNLLHKNKFYKEKKIIKKLLYKRPLYENINKKREDFFNNYLIDKYSKNIILKKDLFISRKKRVSNYNKWFNFAIKNNLKPIFSTLNNYDLNPWCCPVYSSSVEETKNWYKWGWKNNFFVYSWPDLPIEISNENNLKQRFERLICFSTDTYID